MATEKVVERKPNHPPYTVMVGEALMVLDKEGEGKLHGHGLTAIKQAIADKHKLHAGWEKRLTHVINIMVDKHMLEHVPGHLHTYKMSHEMKAKMEHKQMPRKEKAPEKEKAAPIKRKMTKAKSPAKRAKKADVPKAK